MPPAAPRLAPPVPPAESDLQASTTSAISSESAVPTGGFTEPRIAPMPSGDSEMHTDSQSLCMSRSSGTIDQ